MATATSSTGHSNFGMLDIELVQQYTQNLESLLTIQRAYNYNTTSKVLYVESNPKLDQTVMLHVYEEISVGDASNDFNNIYDNRWIKAYAVAKARMQWAINLGKYSGSVLPNGLQLDVDRMQTMAEQQIEKLEEQLMMEYEEPMGMFVG